MHVLAQHPANPPAKTVLFVVGINEKERINKIKKLKKKKIDRRKEKKKKEERKERKRKRRKRRKKKKKKKTWRHNGSSSCLHPAQSFLPPPFSSPPIFFRQKF